MLAGFKPANDSTHCRTRWAPHVVTGLFVGLLTILSAMVFAASGAPLTESSSLERDVEESDRESSLAEELQELKELVAQLQKAHNTEVAELKARIAELEKRLADSGKEPSAETELEELRREAEELTEEEEAKEAEAEKKRKKFQGFQRTLQSMNPEISALGDISYDVFTDDALQDSFFVRGLELSLQAPLDPFTRMKVFLSAHQEPRTFHAYDHDSEDEEGDAHAHSDEISVNLEEAFMEWVALPGNLRARIGKFRQQFGTLNRWHPHSLPTVDIPLPLQHMFGHDGLTGLGVGFDLPLPGLWASTHTLTGEVVNASNDTAFAGSEFRDPTFLLRFTNFFDVNPDTYIEVGLNGIMGPRDPENDLKTRIGAVDFTFVWEPVQRAKYRSFELRGEYFRVSADTHDFGDVDSDLWFAVASYKFARNWYVGLRYDDTELPFPVHLFHEQEWTPGLKETAWSPFITFWQSEFVRLRLQYQRLERDFAWAQGPEEDQVWSLQFTWAAGPHKHESY